MAGITLACIVSALVCVAGAYACSLSGNRVVASMFIIGATWCSLPLIAVVAFTRINEPILQIWRLL